jgi:hypothetical protein
MTPTSHTETQAPPPSTHDIEDRMRSEETIIRLEKDLLELRAAKEALEREHAALTQTLRQRSAAISALGIRPGGTASSRSLSSPNSSSIIYATTAYLDA